MPTINDLAISFGATGAPQLVTIAEQVYAGMPVGHGAVTQSRWRANPITVSGIVFTVFPGLDSDGRADCWIYAAYGEAVAPNTASAINREHAAVDLQVTLSGVAQNLFGAGTTYSYEHQRSTWLRWQSSGMAWDTSSAFINARIADGTFLRHDSHGVFGSADSDVTFPSVVAYQPFKTFCDIAQTNYIGDQPRSATQGAERTAIGPVHEWFARLISEVGTNNNPAWLTANRLQILKDLAETAAQFPHASGLMEPTTYRLLDPSLKPHCSHDNANAWFSATGIPQPGFADGTNQFNCSYDNSHPLNKFSFQAFHLSKDPFHLLNVQGQAVTALTYQSLYLNGRGADGKTLQLSRDQERGMWWGLQMLFQAWHATPAGTMPKPFRDKAWFATAIDNSLKFLRDHLMSATDHIEAGVIGEAMRFWRVTALIGPVNNEARASHFQEDYGHIVLAQALLLGYSAARDVAEWRAVNIQRRLEMGGSWFLNDYDLELNNGFSGYALGPATGTLPYTNVAEYKAWYPRKPMYADGTISSDFWRQQYGRDTYLFLGAVNVTKEAAARGLMTLGFDAAAQETALRARFTPPYIASFSGLPLNYAMYAKQYFTYQGATLTAPSDSYSVANGQPMYFGRAAPLTFTTAGDVIVDGDSNTDVGWNNAAFRLGFPLTKFPPRIVFNAGVAGQTTQQLADKLAGDIAKFPAVKVWVIRVGTNGWNMSLAEHQAQFNRIFSTLEANLIVAVIHAIPPRSEGTLGTDSGLIAVNAWLKAQCEAKPDRRFFVEDSIDLGDANYNALAAYYFEPEAVGRVHPNGKGIVAQAQRMLPRYLQIFPHIDPRIIDGNDTYAKTSASNQYVVNPLMANPVAASFNGGAITGTIPSGYEMSNGNSGGTGCAVSIAPADAGDAVQAPWLRMAMRAGGAGHYLFVQTALTHPAIAADDTVKRFDIVAELRFNALDTSVINGITMSLFNSDGLSGFPHQLNLSGNPGVLTMSMVLRSSNVLTQEQHGTTTRALRAYPANSLMLRFYFDLSGALVSMGSVDIRCISVRAVNN